MEILPIELGGSDSDILKIIVERMGKETVKTLSFGNSRGKMGLNKQEVGRELMSRIQEADKRYLRANPYLLEFCDEEIKICILREKHMISCSSGKKNDNSNGLCQ